MSAALVLMLRHWPALLTLPVILVLALLLHLRTDQRNAARTALEREQAAFATFRARARAEAEAAARRFVEAARRVEADQNRITQEVSRDYQARLADLRARAERLRPNADGVHSGGAAAPAMPRLSHASGGPDAAAGACRLPHAEALIATEQAIRLEELQRWVRRQTEAGQGGEGR